MAQDILNTLPVANYTNTVLSPSIISLPGDSQDILERMKNISTDCFFKSDKVLVNKFKNIEPLELSQLLHQFFVDSVKEKLIHDPVKFLDGLAEVIPLAKIQEVVKDDVEEALIEAKSMFEEAKLYLQHTDKNTSPSIKVRLTFILDGIISVIETLLTSFGIGDIFEPSESNLHADNKSQKILMVLSYFTILTSMIPVLGAALSGLIVGGALLTISALSIIWPHIKPKTRYLPANAENWTRQAKQGALNIQGRKESLDEIANIIKMNRHAILVGPSRAGKTLTAKAFAQAVERGDYPELNGKVVFCLNTAELIGQKASFLGNANKILNKISETMGRHRDDIILVIDGIHIACKKKEKIADQMTFFLEDGGHFPHVIAITTDAEYDEYVKDNLAFALRFDKVNINSMGKDETREILYDALLKSSDKPLIKEEALTHIFNQSNQEAKSPQPAASLKLLKQCINKTKSTQKTPTENKVSEVSQKLFALRSQAVITGNRKKETALEIAELESQMEDLQDELKAEKKEVDQLFKDKELFDLVKKEVFATVIKISTVQNTFLKTDYKKQLKLFLLLKQFMKPLLESHLEDSAKSLGINLFIDNELVEKAAN